MHIVFELAHDHIRDYIAEMPKRKISAAEFKAKCLSLLDEVAETGEGVIVTKRGTAVAQVVPMVERSGPLFGCLAGSMTVRDPGDALDAWGKDEAKAAERRLDRLARELVSDK